MTQREFYRNINSLHLFVFILRISVSRWSLHPSSLHSLSLSLDVYKRQILRFLLLLFDFLLLLYRFFNYYIVYYISSLQKLKILFYFAVFQLKQIKKVNNYRLKYSSLDFHGYKDCNRTKKCAPRTSPKTYKTPGRHHFYRRNVETATLSYKIKQQPKR